jgi:hypothetical protein
MVLLELRVQGCRRLAHLCQSNHLMAARRVPLRARYSQLTRPPRANNRSDRRKLPQGRNPRHLLLLRDHQHARQ